jgi:hypothetical protein
VKYLTFPLALALLLAVSACAGTGEKPMAKKIPPEFQDTLHTIYFQSEKPFATLQNKLSKSQCGQESDESSTLAMMSGLSSRPSTSASLFVDAGEQADGSKWYALKATSHPELALCGVSLKSEGQGTEVGVIGLRRKNTEAIAQAVESGTFFCHCRELSK